MPIIPTISLRHLSQAEFGEIAFAVMRHVFAIHREFGRLFRERIYKQELARRLADTRLEVAVDVVHRSFSKRHFLDVLVGDGALFEFKASEAIIPRYRAQTTHYLLLAELGHAKLINTRPESVEHEFVNTSLTKADRLRFKIDTHDWEESIAGALPVAEVLLSLLHDWGTGLELTLYEDALVHFLGGEAAVCADVPVIGGEVELGLQRFRMAGPRVAFKLTALTERQSAFAEHARRLLHHTRLQAILWINITLDTINFTTLR